MSRLHRIDLPTAGRLAIAARPRAEDWLAEDIAAWVGEGIAVVVSLLEPAEVHDLGLQREAALCSHTAWPSCHFRSPTVVFLRAAA